MKRGMGLRRDDAADCAEGDDVGAGDGADAGASGVW